MIVDTCQCFGGPFPQRPGEPTPGRCTNPGERWATVSVPGSPARSAIGSDRVVVWACPFQYDVLADWDDTSRALPTPLIQIDPGDRTPAGRVEHRGPLP